MNGPQRNHMPWAIREMENANGFSENQIAQQARERTERPKMCVRNGNACPTANQLVEELGGMVENSGSTKTRETRYT